MDIVQHVIIVYENGMLGLKYWIHLIGIGNVRPVTKKLLIKLTRDIILESIKIVIVLHVVN